MIKARSEDDEKRLKSDWQAIRWRMNERRTDPTKLSKLTGYSESDIKKGIGGELIPIPLSFLRNAVRAFRLVEARAKTYEEDPLDLMSYEEYMELIKPPPAMPPRQGNFWELQD